MNDDILADAQKLRHEPEVSARTYLCENHGIPWQLAALYTKIARLSCDGRPTFNAVLREGDFLVMIELMEAGFGASSAQIVRRALRMALRQSRGMTVVQRPNTPKDMPH